MQILSASIDLTKIDKSKIVEKNGKKWYNISIFINDELDQYGNNVQVVQSQSKEEKGQPKVFLGNGKVNYTSTPQTTQNEPTKQEEATEDLPF